MSQWLSLHRFLLVPALVCSVTASSVAAQIFPAEPPPDLLELADRYCLDTDGDHALTWAIAAHDGYVALSGADFPGLRTPGARQVRGFSKIVDGTEIRVLTAVNRWAYGPGRGGGAANFHLCWVSAKPSSRATIDRAVREAFKLDRFRQEDAWVYAWILGAGGARQTVKRSDFNRRFIELARDQGMRMVMTNAYDGWVSITYMRPVESCADWCY